MRPALRYERSIFTIPNWTTRADFAKLRKIVLAYSFSTRFDCMTSVPPLRGNLHDIGPDGLGFIIPEDNPNISYAFSIRTIRDFPAPSFTGAGCQEGDLVEFYLTEKRNVIRVVPLKNQ